MVSQAKEQNVSVTMALVHINTTELHNNSIIIMPLLLRKGMHIHVVFFDW